MRKNSNNNIFYSDFKHFSRTARESPDIQVESYKIFRPFTTKIYYKRALYSRIIHKGHKGHFTQNRLF